MYWGCYVWMTQKIQRMMGSGERGWKVWAHLRICGKGTATNDKIDNDINPIDC